MLVTLGYNKVVKYRESQWKVWVGIAWFQAADAAESKPTATADAAESKAISTAEAPCCAGIAFMVCQPGFATIER